MALCCSAPLVVFGGAVACLLCRGCCRMTPPVVRGRRDPKCIACRVMAAAGRVVGPFLFGGFGAFGGTAACLWRCRMGRAAPLVVHGRRTPQRVACGIDAVAASVVGPFLLAVSMLSAVLTRVSGAAACSEFRHCRDVVVEPSACLSGRLRGFACEMGARCRVLPMTPLPVRGVLMAVGPGCVVAGGELFRRCFGDVAAWSFHRPWCSEDAGTCLRPLLVPRQGAVCSSWAWPTLALMRRGGRAFTAAARHAV